MLLLKFESWNVNLIYLYTWKWLLIKHDIKKTRNIMLWIKIFHMFTQIILWQKNSFLCIIKVLWLIIITIVNLSTTIKATLNLINCFLLFFKRKEVAYMSYSCLFYTLCSITIQFTIHCLLHSSTIYTSPFNLILW